MDIHEIEINDRLQRLQRRYDEPLEMYPNTAQNVKIVMDEIDRRLKALTTER